MSYLQNVRQVYLYCLLLVDNENDVEHLSVKVFLNSDACVSKICEYRTLNNIKYLDSFSRYIYVTPDHPLYPYGKPLEVTNNSVKLKK